MVTGLILFPVLTAEVTSILTDTSYSLSLKKVRWRLTTSSRAYLFFLSFICLPNHTLIISVAKHVLLKFCFYDNDKYCKICIDQL